MRRADLPPGQPINMSRVFVSPCHVSCRLVTLVNIKNNMEFFKINKQPPRDMKALACDEQICPQLVKALPCDEQIRFFLNWLAMEDAYISLRFRSECPRGLSTMTQWLPLL